MRIQSAELDVYYVNLFLLPTATALLCCVLCVAILFLFNRCAIDCWEERTYLCADLHTFRLVYSLFHYFFFRIIKSLFFTTHAIPL